MHTHQQRPESITTKYNQSLNLNCNIFEEIKSQPDIFLKVLWMISLKNTYDCLKS